MTLRHILRVGDRKIPVQITIEENGVGITVEDVVGRTLADVFVAVDEDQILLYHSNEEDAEFVAEKIEADSVLVKDLNLTMFAPYV